ncbi:Hypothetical Protein FCC1311_026642 [Hondaea fermentalgiana]|uniref:Uncharacterized protein n=1 Tax=Hondaea fermentalgiana TaxID=2315210 RepID=A0A2R5GCX4_9STRA|nr:Hypothetical Protein FCC1311_026642 [Hondaea fermentalgiana]|eukprot:GBG26443.1 Hypothetical Protein FCC1311_026642 [Hondaea fermentalgiana]
MDGVRLLGCRSRGHDRPETDDRPASAWTWRIMSKQANKRGGAAVAPASTPLLGQLELTQQPEAVFYKDEGGQKWYYLFVFFVVRGEQTPELKRAYDRVADGRRRIPIDCTLLYDSNMEPVADQSILNLLGSSRDDGEVSDGTPEFDVSKGTGSVRYRINKVSLRKDNQGFRLKLQLRGLENLIKPVVTEATQVFSKRKRLRKEHREPEQHKRTKVEVLARRRNEEVERKLARQSMQSTPLIHRVLSDPALTKVPEYPEMRQHAEDGDIFDEVGFRHAKRGRMSEGATEVVADDIGQLIPPQHHDEDPLLGSHKQGSASDLAAENASLRKRVANLESRMMHIDEKFGELLVMLQFTIPAYTPEGEHEDTDGEGQVGLPIVAGESALRNVPAVNEARNDNDDSLRKVNHSLRISSMPSLRTGGAPSYPLREHFASLIKSFSAGSHHTGGAAERLSHALSRGRNGATSAEGGDVEGNAEGEHLEVHTSGLSGGVDDSAGLSTNNSLHPIAPVLSAKHRSAKRRR